MTSINLYKTKTKQNKKQNKITTTTTTTTTTTKQKQNDWNNLSHSIVQIQDPANFKAAVLEILKQD